ncbi:hypothetical protein FKO01_25340 [Mesorhizobium sp. B2-3-3]|nr:hypothetical protein FKO01_25340 [Mesorhizobium sp. B2-3-3]
MVDLAKHARMTDVLTVPRDKIARSIVGMAHFAGTGPAGKTCSGCDHWLTQEGKKILICDKYRSLTGDNRKAVPASSPVCRHFVERPK